MLYAILSKLLDYPDKPLLAALPDLKEELILLEAENPKACQAIKQFTTYLASRSLIELQATYVNTFDLTPEHSLHLTHHIFNDDHNRGPALIDLTEFYKAYDLHLAAHELPDYLPLMLEFASQLNESESQWFFTQWIKILQTLANHLESAGSPYASLIRLVEPSHPFVEVAA